MSKDDIFEEARKESIKKAIENNIPMNVEIQSDFKERNLPAIKERVEEGETQWDLLKKMVDGSFTERFITVMQDMPDRDFARNYLKLLEHFKAKVTRTESDGLEAPDMTINIQTVIVNEKGHKEVIQLEDITDGSEQEQL
jgi:hypothetical protein